jgi:hypothetical protein
LSAESSDKSSLTPAEDALFRVVGCGITLSPLDLAGFAAGEFHGKLQTTTEERRSALDVLLAEGWLQVIDSAARTAIAAELHQQRVAGPIYGLPTVGGVDFTPAGAAFWCKLSRDRNRRKAPAVFTDVVHTKAAYYFTTRATALRVTGDKKNWEGEIGAFGPFPIGPWRARWWQYFAEGYRMDVEEWHQWSGNLRIGEGWFRPRPPAYRTDPRSLLRILDYHQMNFAEWIVLAALEDGGCYSPSDLPRIAAGSAERNFGMAASEEECRNGLAACQSRGWVRILEENAVTEIEALLRDRRTVVPLRDEVGSLGDLDFTASGSELYQTICIEWLGQEWVNDFRVWKEYYREEHQYCEKAEGLEGIEADVAAREVVRDCKLVPIGPWCVRWWERFVSGYRLELKIGEP